MPTYSKKNFEHITAAIGKSNVEVECHETVFEAAAMWYRLKSTPATNKRVTPYKTRRRMT
jgi:hypothetical protein